jgi:hypothetical protein
MPMTASKRRRSSFARYALPLLFALTTSAFGSPMKTPDIKQNPNPTQRYDITLKIDDAPGPFDAISASLDYQVSNDRCVPLTPGSGATIVPQEHIPLALTHVGGNVYTATIYTDRFLDEDYYGMGVCHWEFVAVGIELKIGQVDFSPSLFLKDLKAGHAVVTYFSKNQYARSVDPGMQNLTDTGRFHREEYKDPANTFSATLSAQERVQ